MLGGTQLTRDMSADEKRRAAAEAAEARQKNWRQGGAAGGNPKDQAALAERRRKDELVGKIEALYKARGRRRAVWAGRLVGGRLESASAVAPVSTSQQKAAPPAAAAAERASELAADPRIGERESARQPIHFAALIFIVIVIVFNWERSATHWKPETENALIPDARKPCREPTGAPSSPFLLLLLLLLLLLRHREHAYQRRLSLFF